MLPVTGRAVFAIFKSPGIPANFRRETQRASWLIPIRSQWLSLLTRAQMGGWPLVLLVILHGAKESLVRSEVDGDVAKAPASSSPSTEKGVSFNKTERIQYILAKVAGMRENRTEFDGEQWGVKVIALLQEAEKHGSSEATTVMGDLHLLGEGVPRDFAEAKTIFQRAADKGNPEAQLHLGFLYSVGLHKSGLKDRDEQLSLLNYYFSALGGVPEAQMVLGDKHLHGYGVPKSCNAAIKYYSKVAQKVVLHHSEKTIAKPIELVRLSDDKARNNKLEETEDVIQYYQHSADNGNADAQVALGQLNFYGARGVAQNTRLAAEYFRAAAAQGNAAAKSNLAQMHIQGLGVEENNQTAFKYFEEAAGQGDAAAQNGLGYMYLHGIGTKQDHGKAMKFFKMSAEQGNVDAQFNLGAMYFAGMGIDVDYGAALQYFTLAGHQGHIRSLFNLAQMHMNGLGTVQSCPIAVKVFKSVAERGQWAQVLSSAHKNYLRGEYEAAFIKYARAANQGYEMAQSNVAWLIDRELGYSLKDMHSVALEQLLRAAKQGNVDANRMIGDHFYYGLASEMPDYKKAAKYYSVAGEQKNAHSNFNLGFMHQHGIGLPFDLHLAKRFYDLALESSADAYIPVQIALLGLQIHKLFLQCKGFWEGTSSTSSATGTGGSGDNGGTKSEKSKRSSKSSSQDLTLTWEDVLLLVACGLLAVLVFFRSRRIT